MYIHWSHHYIPKVFDGLSFIFNPIFILLIHYDRKSITGVYAMLLKFFAVFDMIYSLIELIAPVAISGYTNGYIIYLCDGPLMNLSPEMGQKFVSLRCSCISLSYGILIIHFFYRYFAIFHPHMIDTFGRTLRGKVIILSFFLAHGIAWFTVCELFLYGNDEMRNYSREDFQTKYNVNSSTIAMLGTMYREVSTQLRTRSWIGILGLTVISIYAVSVYVILGIKIMMKLHENKTMSENTRKLHNKLFTALIIQTVIPITISFAPCLSAWYFPLLGWDAGEWNNYGIVTTLSMFPALDPLAIILLLPNYRKRLFMFMKSFSIRSMHDSSFNSDMYHTSISAKRVQPSTGPH